jgi:hypothetical protein
MAHFAFRMLGVRRVTAHTKSQNMRLIKQMLRGGWLIEGYRKKWFFDDDAAALVLFPEQAERWMSQ